MQPEYPPHKKALLLSVIASAFAVAACGGGSSEGAGPDTSAASSDSGEGREAAQAVTPTWTKIAVEGQSFTVSKASTVRFGTGTSWVTRTVTGTGVCSNTYFGTDPAYGKPKECDLSSVPPTNSPAPAPAPAPSSSALLGSTSVQSSVDSNAAGMAEAFIYTAAASGSANTLRVYIDAGNNAQRLIAGVYADSNGAPGRLLASGAMDRPTGAAWNTVNLPTFSVSKGATYWIALLSPSGTGALKFRDIAAGGGSAATSSQTSLTGLPTTWSVGRRYDNSPASVYLSYGSGSASPTPAPAPSPTPTPSPSPSPTPSPSPSPSPSPAPAPAPATNGTASLAWTAVSGSGVTGYRLYYGTASRQYAQSMGAGISVGSSASYTVTGLTKGKTYYFAVTSIDGKGNESALSNEATKAVN